MQGLEGIHPTYHRQYYRRTSPGIIYDTLTVSEVNMNKILHTRRMIDTQIGFTGSTVRKGTAWVELTNMGEVVDLCVCSSDGEQHEVIGTAKILERWWGIFAAIPARYVEMEHIEENRSYSSLLSSLRTAYHQRGAFSVDDVVTVLVYQRLS